MKLVIQSRSGREVVPGGVQVDDGATVRDLMQAFHKLRPKYYPSRQRFSLAPKAGEKRGVALVPGKKLSDFDLRDGSVLTFKDLGPQIGYQTVFFWEYFGPLLVYAAFYLFPEVFYPSFKSIPTKSPVQTLALAYWSFHYAKRVAETYLVHRFSHGTMPLFNLFKNCSYYWGFAAYVSYFVNHPLYTAPSVQRAQIALGLAVVCQLSNFWCHRILANLRPPGSTEYKIPRGFLFNYITCANYTMETWGWILFGVATQTLSAFLFILAGFTQMSLWALAKHRRLRKLFDGKDGRPKYPRRWVIFPPFI
ncbi:hypothetical protein WJX72_005670 [[Myrmecia] bisecta]|uniref:3-oxo-5-alpha-steroid 4-dehydrogenase C-terminal domain-containing protein n=1 Tax=[Myrmecia] bisecta TaxID=41462 RepID=A0AAW1QF71_9CHLO